MSLIRKIILLPLIAVLLSAISSGVAVAYDAKGNYTVYGSGTHSCAKVLEEHRKDSVLYNYYASWAQGYMTAAGLFNDTEKPLGDVGADIEGIMHLIRGYCEENPLDNLTRAAEDVAEQVLNRAG